MFQTKVKIHKRLFALLLVFALVIGLLPSVLADNEPSTAESAEETLVDSQLEESTAISPPTQSILELDEAVESSEVDIDGEAEIPTSMDGETLTRTDNDGIMLLGGGGTMGKSTCVTFAAYQSARWKCHRYEVDGSHSYGHYFYTSEIAYHTIDGVDSYCIEPNTTSLGGQYYTSYTADEASSSSYWKLELDDLQRSHIQKILAFGYPQVDYGYSRQVQYAATQVLIWEVVSHSRYNTDIKSCSDYGLYRNVYAVLGADFKSCYNGILNAISISDGTVPSFAGASQSNAKSITLTLNNATGCYEGSVRDAAGVLSHFTFSASGVNFSQNGSTLYISVPAANTDAVKGQTITGTSDQKIMSTSNPIIWENPTYQTVLTAGGADYLHAYISLTWADVPKTGSLVVSKAVNYGSWSGFTFRLHGTSDKGNSVDVTATTGSDGKAYFKDIEIGTYTLEEVSPGNAYILPEPQTVTIPGDEIAYTNMENVWKHWRATITKVDADTGKAAPQGDATLNGAEYTLYKSGKAVATYTVSNGGFATDLFPCTADDGVYTLKETKAPSGYKLDETAYKLKTSYDRYSEKENSFSVTVSDAVMYGKIQLTKYALNTVSGDKQPEEGATFTVYLKSAGSYDKAKDSERDIITIGKNGKGTSKSLPYGTYCVQQSTGWAGYDRDETVYEVTISKDGQTVTKDNSGHDLTIYNNIWTGKLSILKVDGADNTPLSGAIFTLTGSDGSESTLSTGEDGTVTFENLVFGITYVWKETKAPKGYLLSEGNTGIWSVEEHDAEIQYTAKDDRRPGSITVTKQNTDGQPLFGATFLLEYKDGDTWKPVYHSDSLAKGGTSTAVSDGKLTTDESGTITFENLWADEEIQYRLTEIGVPIAAQRSGCNGERRSSEVSEVSALAGNEGYGTCDDDAPEGYELLKEPIFEGTLPVSYPDGKVTATPDEVIDGMAYFYNLPITVQNGHIYTLPMTGGSGFPFAGVGIAALVLGLLLFANGKYPIILKNLKRRISHEN